ncbi:hypothetical protein HK101_004597, partial [Irineochytrium annulatum]
PGENEPQPRENVEPQEEDAMNDDICNQLAPDDDDDGMLQKSDGLLMDLGFKKPFGETPMRKAKKRNVGEVDDEDEEEYEPDLNNMDLELED